MKTESQRLDDETNATADCVGCALPRRKFLAACATCAAGAAGLAPWMSRAPFAAESKKPRIRLVFSHPAPDRITWPNIGYDYQSRANQILAELAPLCPEVEFLPVHVITQPEAEKVLAEDAQCDGYLVWVVGKGGGAPTVVDTAGKKCRPMVVVEDHYAGAYSLGFNARAERAKWKAIGLATSRLQDVADVVNCFEVLKQPGGTADGFLAAAKAAYKKNIAPMGDMTCADDPVQANDVSQCLEKLRSSTILLVGRDPGGLDKAIEKEFGVKVVAIKPAELDAAFQKAAPAEASKWADQWIGAAEKMVEPKQEEVVKSGAMHVAMRELMKKHNAQAITINCLGGFYSGQLKAFPCLGFVELNNSGLVGACEGDLSSTITMLAMGYLSGRPGFISDPVIDTAKNQIIYAHCVAPTKVFGPRGSSNPFHIRSHSEDRRGAAVRSLMPLGYMTTTLKFIPGKRQVLLHQGKTVANVDEDKACRTKLAVEVRGDIDKLFRGWAGGWHRVTFYGDLKEPARKLSKALGMALIEEA